MGSIILSICIPTCNRADALEKCLKSIVESPVYKTGKIEIVVSDNASIDNTRDLVLSFQKKYSNILYNLNAENIGGEANFIKVLDIAHGKFKKLHNDYSVFTSEGLNILYNIINDNVQEKKLLFFGNGTCEIDYKVCHNIDEFLKTVSWSASWIGCYGFWDSDWNNIEEKDRCASKLFEQVDWFLRVFETKKMCKIYNDVLTVRTKFQSKQGGYNFIEVHLENYVGMFSGYVRNSTISMLKRKMLLNIVGWYILLKKEKEQNYSYETNGSLLIIFKNYWYYWWFYFDISKAIFRKFFKRYM